MVQGQLNSINELINDYLNEIQSFHGFPFVGRNMEVMEVISRQRMAETAQAGRESHSLLMYIV